MHETTHHTTSLQRENQGFAIIPGIEFRGFPAHFDKSNTWLLSNAIKLRKRFYVNSWGRGKIEWLKIVSER